MEAFRRHLPVIAGLFGSIDIVYRSKEESQCMDAVYEKSISISIDYGILEKAENVFVYHSSNLAWSDIGSWGALYNQLEHDKDGNAIDKDFVFCRNTRNLLVKEQNLDKVVVIDGLDKYIVADTKDALLIYPNKNEEDVQSLIERFSI